VNNIDFADALRIFDLLLTMPTLLAVVMYTLRYTQRYRTELLKRKRLRVTWLASVSWIGLLTSGALVDIQRFGLPLSPVTPVHVAAVILSLITIFLVARADYAEL
jgi:hypothetical protein